MSQPTRKINLLIVAAALHIGGAEVVIQQLAQAIDRRRFNVTVCCIKATGMIGDELLREGIDLVTLSQAGSGSVDYLAFLKLRRLIRARHIDVVHTHTTDALADAAICRLTLPKLRLVHTFHFGNYPHADRQKVRIEWLFSRVADRLIAVGEVQRQQIIRTYGLADRAIARIWNGVPSDRVASDGLFRKRVGGAGRIVIGTVATLIPQKGLPDLLAVASRLREHNDRVLFVVVGDGHLRAELEGTRARLGLEDTVVFAGWVEEARRAAVPDFDLFFQPSRWEAMSIAILEAMAAGKAIVATRTGENPHVIDHGVDGLLVDPGDLDGMTAALVRLVDDHDLRLRLGDAAARKVASRFTADGMTRAYESTYQDMA